MPVDLILLCGFLGSGKTSLIMDYLRQDTGGDTGVVINEVGEVSIDGTIVANDRSGIPVTVMPNGCLCCSLRSSVVDTLMALLTAPRAAGAAPIQRIIVEANGLASPGPVIASLAAPELIAMGVRVMVVSTYDCASGLPDADTFEDAAAQLAAARRVVFTKIDRADMAGLAHHRRIVTGINPFAEILVDEDRTRQVRAAFGSMRPGDPVKEAADALCALGRQGLAHPRIHVFRGSPVQALSWDDVATWLDEVSGLCGNRLLRLKATVHVSDCDDPIWIQSVGTTFSAPRRLGSEQQCSDAFVVIARDVTLEELRGTLGFAPIALSLSDEDAPARNGVLAQAIESV
ncbi:MAG: GTP-binding protein [Castellaniella sp.]|uniref:CobW family GTP-binding protein n=1 Tax=Castellaniella sp. TaxID=1955812 RepID=UPI00121091BB|nr:GTP-binding protein [Castellaniella sp.]TAN31623.1 MAG: GTP-binding protein [Castellaniella sp.]